jgi:hypothetical protein
MVVLVRLPARTRHHESMRIALSALLTQEQPLATVLRQTYVIKSPNVGHVLTFIDDSFQTGSMST